MYAYANTYLYQLAYVHVQAHAQRVYMSIDMRMSMCADADVQEYALGNDGLYTFSLKLEEALP